MAKKGKQHKDDTEDPCANEDYSEENHPHVAHNTKLQVSDEAEAENLGDNFEDSAWSPPSIEKALQCSKMEIIGGGKASVLFSNIEQLEGSGVGLVLYFNFIRRTIWLLAILTILSMPALYVSYMGSRIPEELQDSGSLYKYNIGNIGAANGTDVPTCESLIFANLEFFLGNTTVETNSTLFMDQCLTLYGIDLPMRDISVIISFLEFLSCIVLVIYISRMKEATKVIIQQVDDASLTSTDFAVMVKGLPLNASEGDVLQHFNDLYRLDVADWKKRPAVNGAGPVKDISNTCNPIHEGTYIAEVVILRRIGDLVRKFRKRENMLAELRRTRAQFKMRNVTSPIAALRNSRKAEAALRKSEDIAIGMEGVTTDLAETINYDPDRGFISYTDGADQSDCIAAFVIFNHQESCNRCVSDYQRTNCFLYPKALKFKGKRITVTKAPEPDNVIYENMEISAIKKRLVRMLSSCMAFFLLIVSFAIVLTAFDYKQKFEENMPDLSLCSTEIPSLYLGGRDNLTEVLLEYDIDELPMVRPEMSLRDDQDTVCDSVLSESVYAVYSAASDVNRPAIAYDVSACASDTLCPDMTNALRCPCISPTDTTQCATIDCIATDSQDADSCVTFQYSNVAICYCINRLSREIETNGVIGGIQVMNDEEAVLCGDLLISFTSVNLFRFIAVILIVAINGLLKFVMKFLAKKEHYNSLDSEIATIMSKTFIALYINTALITLIVFGRPPLDYKMPAAAVSLNIFDGVYDDFTVGWYAQVGVQVIMTLIFQTIMMAVIPFFTSVFSLPIKHLLAKKSAYFHSAAISTQDDLNKYFVGPKFDLGLNYSQTLNFLFVCLTFAPGIPFLMPIGLALFICVFYANKRLLLRYLRKPENVASAIQRKVNSILPWALVLRAGFGIWMLSTPHILDSRELQLNEYDFPYASIIGRFNREHVLLNLIFCIGLIIVVAVRFLDRIFPLISTLARIVSLITKVVLFILYLPCYIIEKIRANKVSPTDSNTSIPENSGYTDDFYKVMTTDSGFKLCRCKKAVGSLLTSKQKQEGYTEEYDASGFVVMRRLWMDKGSIYGINYYPGDKMKTWQVVSNGSVCSYILGKIPTYKLAVVAMKESMTNVLIDKALERTGKKKPNREIMAHVSAYISVMGAGMITGLSPTSPSTSKWEESSPVNHQGRPSDEETFKSNEEHSSGVEMANHERQLVFNDYQDAEEEEQGGESYY